MRDFWARGRGARRHRRRRGAERDAARRAARCSSTRSAGWCATARPLDVGARRSIATGTGAAALAAALPGMLDDADRDAFAAACRAARAERRAGGARGARRGDGRARRGARHRRDRGRNRSGGRDRSPPPISGPAAGCRCTGCAIASPSFRAANRWQVLARAGLLRRRRDAPARAHDRHPPGRPGRRGDRGRDRPLGGRQRRAARALPARWSPTSGPRAPTTLTTLPVALRELSNRSGAADRGPSPRVAEGW